MSIKCLIQTGDTPLIHSAQYLCLLGKSILSVYCILFSFNWPQIPKGKAISINELHEYVQLNYADMLMFTVK